MGPSTSSGEGYIDGNHSQPWSPPGRLTVNTSYCSQPSLSTPSDDLSQHSASLPPSSHASPWSSNVSSSPSHTGSYMLPQTTPRPIVTSDGLDQHHPLADSEWNNLFSAPLNPSIFAALAAGGVLGIPSDSSSNLPSTSLQPSHY